MMDNVEIAADKIIEELDGRSVFNGIDDEIKEEIRESLIDILFKEFA